MNIHSLILVVIVSAFATSGCDADDGAAEEARQAVDEAGQELKDAADDVGYAVEDACEEVKEGVDAKDTDC
jgi:predicted small secreted protein